jgi:hypothetical protein
VIASRWSALIVALAGCREAAKPARDAAAPAPAPQVAEPAPCLDPAADHPLSVDPVGLAFLNKRISGHLDVELTEAPVKVSPGLENRKATATAALKDVTLEAKVFTDDDFRPLTAAELDLVVFRGPSLRLLSYGGAVTHPAPRCGRFTVRDVLAAVEETERRTRGDSEWFDGVDVHHVYFEGLQLTDDGAWIVHWGS